MKKKIVEHNEYESWIGLIFRQDNLLRLLGASIPVFAKYFTTNSLIKTNWGEVNSDILFLLLGVVTMIAAPDIRKYILHKFGGDKE